MQGWLSWECYCIFQWVWLGKGVNWWGTEGEHCNLAVCPTAKGIVDKSNKISLIPTICGICHLE